MLKKTILFMFAITLLCSICFAESKDDDYHVRIGNADVYAKDLIISQGEGQYEGYLKMNNYPKEDKFQIYFKDSSHDNIISTHVTYEDLRNLDYDEMFRFTLPSGKMGALSRKQANNIFLSFSGTEAELFLRTVLPEVYNDWFETQAFSTDANSLVNCYVNYKHGVKIKGDTIKIDEGGIRDVADQEDENFDGIVRHKGIFGW